MLTGLWHGASWNFVVWGLYFAAFLVIEKIFLMKYLKKSKILNHIYVLLVVIISFVIFGAVDMKSAGECISGMFGLGNIPFASDEQIYYLRSYAVILIVAIIGATPIPKKLMAIIQEKKCCSNIIGVTEPIVLAFLTIIATSYLVDGSFNPFLYFRF